MSRTTIVSVLTQQLIGKYEHLQEIAKPIRVPLIDASPASRLAARPFLAPVNNTTTAGDVRQLEEDIATTSVALAKAVNNSTNLDAVSDAYQRLSEKPNDIFGTLFGVTCATSNRMKQLTIADAVSKAKQARTEEAWNDALVTISGVRAHGILSIGAVLNALKGAATTARDSGQPEAAAFLEAIAVLRQKWVAEYNDEQRQRRQG